MTYSLRQMAGAVWYPENWSQLAQEIKAICDYRCQACRKQCRRPGEMWLGWEYQLTIAHLDHGYEEPVTCVAALCLPCHLAYDAPYGWVARRRWQRLRRRMAGQLEITYSPI